MKILIKEIKNKYRIYKISNNSIFGDYALKEKGRWFWKYHTMDGTWKMQWDTLEEVIEILQGLEERTGYRFYAMPDEDIKILKKNKLA